MIHTFLRSIGFGDLTKNADLYLILESILNRPDEQNIVKDEYGNEFACFSKSFGTDIGITVCGNFINDKEFRMEYYYPYLHGSQITTCETIEIERHAAREAFAGICDELKLGVTLISSMREKMPYTIQLQDQITPCWRDFPPAAKSFCRL